MAQYSRRYSVVMSKWHFTWCWNAFITLVALHNSKLPECIYTEGHIAFIPGWFALKRMYMSDCTFAMSDCISQMLETHFGKMKVYRLPHRFSTNPSIHSFSGGPKPAFRRNHTHITHTPTYYRKKLCFHFHFISLEKKKQKQIETNTEMKV